MHRASASLFVVTVLAAAPVSAQTVSAAEAGRQSFQVGRALYDQRRFAEALDAFRTSQQVLPSPNTQLYVGRCLREIGRDAEAYRALLRAAQDATQRSAAEPRYAPTADVAQREAAALSARLAFVLLQVPELPAGLSVSVNGEVVSPSDFGGAYAVAPGAVTIEASAAGRAPFRAANTLGPGQQGEVTVRLDGYQPGAFGPTQTVTFTPTTYAPTAPVLVATSASSPLRALGITAVSAGLAAGVGGLVTGLRARSIQDDLNLRCPQGCGTGRLDVRNLVDDGNTMVTLTNVLWGVGGALVVTGAILWIVAPSRAGESFAPSLARVTPWVDPARGSAGLAGTF